METYTVIREFDFRRQYNDAISLLNRCLSMLDELTPPHKITQAHIAEMAVSLSDAINWHDTFVPAKPTLRNSNDLLRKQKLKEKYLSTNIGHDERQKLQAEVRTLETNRYLARAGMAVRHVRPYDCIDEVTGEPTIAMFDKVVAQQFEPAGPWYLSDPRAKTIRDTKTKLFRTFFHSSSKILADLYGAQIFLGIVFSEIYYPKTRGRKKPSKDYKRIFENSVKPLLRSM